MATEETSPQAAAAVNRLRRWAVDPAGGGKIFQWGTPGDFKRCQTFYADKIPAKMIDGWCARLHKLATGAAPGHAPGVEQAAFKAKQAAKKDSGKGKG
jgi:hypothetical protein